MTVEEVKELKSRIYADGKVELSEVKELFAKKAELDNAEEVDEEAYDELMDLLTDAVCDWILEDGKFEEEEASELINLIMDDGTIDDRECSIIVDLADRCQDQDIELPGNFVEAFGEIIDEEADDNNSEEDDE